MTTTTFTAPLTLCWAQIRLLRWVLAILLTTLLVGFIGEVQGNHLIPISELYTKTFLMILAFFVGPVLFGSEYLPGAMDYLKTRPVSPRMVFTIKVSFLIVLSLICVLGWNHGIDSMDWHETILFIALFLNIGFWTSAVTILSKDLVRGFLLGTVPFFLGVGALAYLLEDVFYLLETGGEGVVIDGSFWTLFILSLTPFLFFAILSTCSRSSLRHSLSVSPVGTLSFLMFFLGCLAPSFADYREGNSNVDTLIGEQRNSIIASRRDGDRVLTVEREYKGEKQALHLTERHFNGKTLEVTASSDLVGDINAGSVAAILTEDRLLIGEGQRKLTLFDITEPNTPRIVKTISDREGAISIQQFKPGFVLVTFLEIRSDPDRIQLDDTNSTRQSLALSTGELSEIQSSELAWVNYDFSSQKIFGKDSPFALDTHLGEFIGIVHVEGSPRILGLRFGLFDVEAVGPGLIVGFEKNPVQGGKPIPDYTNPILFDFSEPTQPKRTVIDLPLRFTIPLYQNFIDVSKPSSDPKGQPINVHCALGSEYLLVYTTAMVLAAWDISVRADPKFLGLTDIRTFPIPDSVNSMFRSSQPNTYTPFIREDGAIGYLTLYGPLWLEFPALMKEEDPS